MRYKLLGLAPVLAVMASAAFAVGPDDVIQNPQAGVATARCSSANAQDLTFDAGCANLQKPLRVAAKILPTTKMRPADAKKITRMPWQIGIFQ